MYFSERVTLVSRQLVQNENGYPVESGMPIKKEVWADVGSVGRAEFYKAMALGVESSLSVTLRQEDYSEERELIYKERSYIVYRSFQKGLGYIELTCTDKAAKNG